MKPDLTETQIKALLLAAAGPDRPSAMPYADLLDQAVSETSSVEQLRRIKEQAKELLTQAPDPDHREAAQLLYHAAVAAAFVRHAAEISGRPMRKQQQMYERYAAAWSGDRLGELFRDAALRVAGDHPGE